MRASHQGYGKLKRGQNHLDVKASRDELSQWTRVMKNGSDLHVETNLDAASRADMQEFLSPSAESQAGTTFSTSGTAQNTPTYHVVPESSG